MKTDGKLGGGPGVHGTGREIPGPGIADAEEAVKRPEAAALASSPKRSRAAERGKVKPYLLTGILGAMNDAIFLINPQFDFEYINPVAEREFGPVNGRKCFEYFHGRSDVCPWCERERIVGGRTVRRVYKESVGERVFDVFEAPIPDRKGLICKLAVLHDVTRHRKTQKALKLGEIRFEALVRMSRMSFESASQIAAFALEQAVLLTRSRIGFMGFLNESESEFTCHIESRNAVRQCKADLPSRHLLQEGSLWAETVRQRRPLVQNTLLAGGPERPLPNGHPGVSRLLCIPIFHEGRIVSLAAVANKPIDYDDSDLRQFNLLMDSMWRLIQRQRDQEKLRKSEEQMRFLASKLLDFLEEERARVAQDVHLEIGQMLAAMKFGAENILKTVQEDGSEEKAVPLLSSYVGMLKTAVGKARDIYMNLRPTVLDDFGVIPALFWLCAGFQEKHPNICVDKQLVAEESEIPDSLKLTIFRVVQEALNNSAAHSGADRISLSLKKDEKNLELCFSDNGAGFDVDGTLSAGYTQRGLGLAAMRERIQLSGSHLVIDSRKGHGTCVKAIWEIEDADLK